MNFKNWIVLEGIKIIHIDPEDDWEYGEKAYQIAKEVRIRPDSTKNPTIIALNDKEEVIGAVFTSWSEDKEVQHHEPVYKWDFDVVVDPKWQGYDNVGMKLIKTAETERHNLASMDGVASYTRLWVVNPRLAKILQARHGYDAESEYKDGSAHLVKH